MPQQCLHVFNRRPRSTSELGSGVPQGMHREVIPADTATVATEIVIESCRADWEDAGISIERLEWSPIGCEISANRIPGRSRQLAPTYLPALGSNAIHRHVGIIREIAGRQGEQLSTA